MPTAGELADYFAQRTQLPKDDKGELTKMAQYFEAVRGSDPLRERLREIFSYEQPPTPLHEFLADVPAPLLIVTTNDDDLMERAYRERKKPCDVVIHVTDEEKVLWWPHDKNDPQALLAGDLDIQLDQISVVYNRTRKGWSVALNPAPLSIMTWQRYGVEVYNLELNDWAARIRDCES